MKDNKRVYIAGCGGMLGEAFYNTFKEDYDLRCIDKDVNDSWLSFLDFRDFKKYIKDVKNFNPDYLFHLGAHTDLEYCENNADDAYLNNTLATETAVKIANSLQIPILYISTAGIFDGKKEMYDDWDTPNPVNVYGRSKYLGERAVVENADKYLVCRAGWMIGGGQKKDKKYIHKIMQQLKYGKEELHVVKDKGGIPTYTYDFARNVKLLVENEEWGLYNMACTGEITDNRLEVTRELIKILNLENRVKIIPVESDFFKETYFVQRPPSERLNNLKLKLKGLNLMRNWKDALREYIDNSYKDYLKK